MSRFLFIFDLNLYFHNFNKKRRNNNNLDKYIKIIGRVNFINYIK